MFWYISDHILQESQTVIIMEHFTYALTFLLLYCSSVSVLSDTLSNMATNDVDSISKEILTSGWTGSEDNLDMPDKENTGRHYNLEDSVAFETKTHGRVKRAPLFSDNGYGSRLTAGSKLANDWLALKKVFGSVGPGKRSDDSISYDTNIVKRDHGYGSRVRAGHNIANSLLARNKVFGIYGPGRKRAVYFQDEFSPYKTGGDMLETQKRRLVSDSGYGSRIAAANELARDLSAIDDVFGIYGPGKKR